MDNHFIFNRDNLYKRQVSAEILFTMRDAVHYLKEVLLAAPNTVKPSSHVW